MVVVVVVVEVESVNTIAGVGGAVFNGVVGGDVDTVAVLVAVDDVRVEWSEVDSEDVDDVGNVGGDVDDDVDCDLDCDVEDEEDKRVAG